MHSPPPLGDRIKLLGKKIKSGEEGKGKKRGKMKGKREEREGNGRFRVREGKRKVKK